MTKEYTVGRCRLQLPDDHALDRYQSTWKRYDKSLGYISKIIFSKYPNSTAIDIGANVGDSAALIQQYQTVPVLCIEGNPEFVLYLEGNAEIIKNIEIEECFIGNDGDVVNFEEMKSQGGTATIKNAVGSTGTLTTYMKSLETILKKHEKFKKSKLLKIDTDGFDFQIIQENIDYIKKNKPIIYFEYDITFESEGIHAGKKTLEELIRIGYIKFIVYDNFGNYILSFSDRDKNLFSDLNAFLFSSRFQSGTPSIYYFDICAFSHEDEDLSDRLRQLEIQVS